MPKVFISYSKGTFTGQARLLADLLLRRQIAAEIDPDPTSITNEDLSVGIAESTRFVFLVAPGDEDSDQTIHRVRLVLQKLWTVEDPWLGVVAAAIGGIPSGFRSRRFLHYYSWDDVNLARWLEETIPDDFLEDVIGAGPSSPVGLHEDDPIPLDEWRNRVVHLGEQGYENQSEIGHLIGILSKDVDALEPIVYRAIREAATFDFEDLYNIIDRALLSADLSRPDLAKEYLRLGSEARTIIEAETDEIREKLDYSLGVLASDLGEYQVAYDYLIRAMNSDQPLLGNQPATISALQNLARAQVSFGELSEAVDSLERALSVALSDLGRFHPQTASLAFDLGKIVSEMGDVQRARDLLRLAVDAYARVRPPDSPESLAADVELANLE